MSVPLGVEVCFVKWDFEKEQPFDRRRYLQISVFEWHAQICLLDDLCDLQHSSTYRRFCVFLLKSSPDVSLSLFP